MEKLKYNFTVVPFRFSEKAEDIAQRLLTGVKFRAVCRSEKKYDRLYKHVVSCLDDVSQARSVYEFELNKSGNIGRLIGEKVLITVAGKNGGLPLKTEAYIDAVSAFIFTSGIGFLVVNWIFDNSVELDDLCEILNSLKKIRRTENETLLSLISSGETIDYYGVLEELKEEISLSGDLFFERNKHDYVSATMVNSYTYDTPIDVGRIETEIAMLKRSQGKSYGVCEMDESAEILHPFVNMFWGFSSQGIANINYKDTNIKNDKFLDGFYNNVRQEYLLMTLILLNQEYTLIDYCQKFISAQDDVIADSELDRLNKFKIGSMFTVMSHLEHYRAFYSHFYKVLDIDDILKEVETKQSALYMQRKSELSRLRDKRAKRVNNLTKILSVVLSVFGISGIINNISNLMTKDTALAVTFAVLCAVAVTVAVVFLITKRLEEKDEIQINKRKGKK